MIRVPVVQNHDSDQVLVDGKSVTMNKMGIQNVSVSDQSGQTAYHIPEGSLLIYTPFESKVSTVRESISTLDVAPMILNNFGITPPTYMRSQ